MRRTLARALPQSNRGYGLRLSPTARILVVKMAGIGDLLLAVPALRGLRASYPDARIDVLTTPDAAPLLRDSPLVDGILTVDKVAFDYPRDLLRAPWRLARVAALAARLRAHSYDAVLLMHHLTLPFGRLKYRALLAITGAPLRVGLDNGFGAFLSVRIEDRGFGARHEAQYMVDVARAIGEDTPERLLGPTRSDLGWHALADGASPTGRRDRAQPLVALHPGSGSYSLARRWPVERWVEVAQALHAEQAAEIALIIGPDERELAELCVAQLDHASWVRLIPAQSDLRALAAELAAADLFIGNDSLPSHLAAAVGTPVVAVFGPSNHRAWAPLPSRPDAFVAVVRRDLPCSPCFYVGHSLGTPQGCPPRFCLTELPAGAVLAQAHAALATLHSRPAPTPDAGSAA